MANLTTLESEVIQSMQDLESIKTVEVSTIDNQDDYIKAGDVLAGIKRAITTIDNRRAALKAPVLEQGKLIDATFKPIIETAKGLQTKMENAMKAWAKAEADRKEAWIKKQREEEQAKMEAEKNRLAQVAAETESKNKFVSEMALGMAQSIEEQQIKDAGREVKAMVRTLGGETKMTAAKEWKFEILVPAAVPREYCEPVDKLIRAAVKSGVRDIPGVKIYEDIKFINK